MFKTSGHESQQRTICDGALATRYGLLRQQAVAVDDGGGDVDQFAVRAARFVADVRGGGEVPGF